MNDSSLRSTHWHVITIFGQKTPNLHDPPLYSTTVLYNYLCNAKIGNFPQSYSVCYNTISYFSTFITWITILLCLVFHVIVGL